MAELYDWNVVITGAWNPVILSPDGVRRRLFELPDGTPIDIEVPIDRPAPFRIGHDGLVVVAGGGRLAVSTRVPSPESLTRAALICQRALEKLPETPVTAGGVNVRYRLAKFTDSLFDLVACPFDGVLSDAGFEVVGSLTKRTIKLDVGVINYQIQQTESGGTFELNFHRESANPIELRDWIGRASEFVTVAERLVAVAGVDIAGKQVNA